MKSLDLQTTINNLTDAKSNEDAKDGLIGSALSGLGMSGENLALPKLYTTMQKKSLVSAISKMVIKSKINSKTLQKANFKT